MITVFTVAPDTFTEIHLQSHFSNILESAHKIFICVPFPAVIGILFFTDDIKISVVEHYLGPLGAEVDHDITVKPVPWPVPSVESLWLGVKPENKLRRIKAFMSCMNVGPNPFMSNTAHVPERFLPICSVLR